jgi:hypothetical protein
VKKRIFKKSVSREAPCRQHVVLKEKLGKGQINILMKMHHPEVPLQQCADYILVFFKLLKD